MGGKNGKDFNLPDLRVALDGFFKDFSAEYMAGIVTAVQFISHSGLGPIFLWQQNLETMPLKVWKRMKALQKIQGQHDELEAQYLVEREALEAKYQILYQPLYTKRYEIVNGVVEVEGVTNDPSEETPAEEKPSEEKGVPNFWFFVITTNEVLSEEIQGRDDEALKFVKDVKWSKMDDPKGFKLEFLFDPNPYFKNSILTKTYLMTDWDGLDKAIGTVIQWYPGECMTGKVRAKKPRKGSKNTTEKCKSFFDFFSPPEVPDDINEELLQNQMEQDYNIGCTIRDKIIPHAVSLLMGEAADNIIPRDVLLLMGEDVDMELEGEDDDEEGEDDDEEGEDVT